MWQIQSMSAIALGNGTRPRGFVFGLVEGEDQITAAVEAAQNADFGVVAELVTPEDGVAVEELVNALRTSVVGGPVQIVDPSRPEKSDSASDAKQIRTEDLELTPGVMRSLIEAGLNTVGDIIAFADANEGLQSIDGIGEAAEAKVVAALKKL